MANQLSFEGYELVFEDDFDGEHLSRDDWRVELHDPGWVNEEWQRYVDSDENILVKDGTLYIQPVKTLNPNGTISYTSGRISTLHKHDFTYGIFEARLRVPRGKGYLPAFWLLGCREDEGEPWPRCGEIDIMEIWGDRRDTVYGTIHYGDPHEQNQGTLTTPDTDYSDDFHTFAVKWEYGRLRWYVDGTLFHEATEWFSSDDSGEKNPFPAPFDHDHYIILNLAVGNNWAGYPDASTDFNTAFAVDYVRVYQKKGA